mgnify:CR=1 FL=1
MGSAGSRVSSDSFGVVSGISAGGLFVVSKVETTSSKLDGKVDGEVEGEVDGAVEGKIVDSSVVGDDNVVDSRLG